MAYDFKILTATIGEIEAWLRKELASIRTGRAAPAILDIVSVEAYGSKMPLRELASITVESPRTLRVVPWDASQNRAVEKAVTDANLGLSVSADESGVRVSFPELTAERRESLMKIARDRFEQARVRLRLARDEVWSDIQDKTRDGEMSEDEKFRLKDAMQKIVDDGNKTFEDMAERKEIEISA